MYKLHSADANRLAANPLIIVGAPRSGTNALRDSICGLSGFSTWPCDEINYIWRYGNCRESSDILAPYMATDRVRSYIISKFIQIYLHSKEPDQDSVVVEKTCANCLRLPFVSTIFPEARYIYIERNPYDVVASSLKRWRADLDIPYLIRKALYVPKADLPYYFLSYLKSRFYKTFSGSKALSSWGPRFPGIDAMRQNSSLEYLCAYQWSICCLAAKSFFSESSSTVFSINYDDLAARPFDVVSEALNFFGYFPGRADLLSATASIHSKSVGTGNLVLSDQQKGDINAAISQSKTDFSSFHA